MAMNKDKRVCATQPVRAVYSQILKKKNKKLYLVVGTKIHSSTKTATIGSRAQNDIYDISG